MTGMSGSVLQQWSSYLYVRSVLLVPSTYSPQSFPVPFETALQPPAPQYVVLHQLTVSTSQPPASLLVSSQVSSLPLVATSQGSLPQPNYQGRTTVLNILRGRPLGLQLELQALLPLALSTNSFFFQVVWNPTLEGMTSCQETRRAFASTDDAACVSLQLCRRRCIN